MITKKHYIAIAAMLKEHVAPKSQMGNGPLADAYWQSRRDIAVGLADYFQRDNPRFDRDRFMIAAGVPR